MQLFRGLHTINHSCQGAALTIGNFDGVHLGHQAILRKLVADARSAGLPAGVMIFEPQPKEFFSIEHAPLRITGFRDKVCQLEACGIDFVICVPFNASFRALSAEQFINDVLVDKLSVKHVMIGDDFRFGCDRRGNIDFLLNSGERCGFHVTNSSTIAHMDQRISSTRIRQELARGAIAPANELLGWNYRISGRVVHGEQLGRTIGVPTANIKLGGINPALQGVIAVNVSGADFGPYPGVANLGPKPTVGGFQAGLEVHLLDYESDLYGRLLVVEMMKHIRPIEKFDSLDALKAHIVGDLDQARTFFNL